MNFSGVSKDRRPPPKTVSLEPDAFASAFAERPKTTVAIGLRKLSDHAETWSRAAAEKTANSKGHGDQDNWNDCFNDALMAQFVARSVCDPNDARAPCSHLPMAEDHISFELTPAGIKYLWDEIEKLRVETSPLHPEATDGDVRELMDRLAADDAMAELDPIREGRLRRFLMYCLDELRGDIEDEFPDE